MGVSSMKKSGADAGTKAMPCALSMSWPVSCTIKSRAKRSGHSTMIVLAPFDATCDSIAMKPGRLLMGSAPLTAAS